MFCERCGTEIKNPSKKFCHACGSALNHQYKAYTEPQIYETITTARHYPDASKANKAQASYPGYAPPQQGPFTQNRALPPGSTSAQGTSQGAIPGYTATASNKKDGALIAELIFSLFGLFGIGWLMGKETVIGALLLLGSIFVYWPLIILGTILTYGLSLICMGPLAVVAIIVNILLLNHRLTHKAPRFFVTSSFPFSPPKNRPPR
jgi:hypothetical protein